MWYFLAWYVMGLVGIILTFYSSTIDSKLTIYSEDLVIIVSYAFLGFIILFIGLVVTLFSAIFYYDQHREKMMWLLAKVKRA